MIAELQNLALALGKWGCFEFAIMHAAEVERGTEAGPPLALHVEALRRGYVTPDCTVGPAGDMMGWLCGDGSRWDCLKAGIGVDSHGRPYDLPMGYVIQPREHDIGRYELVVKDGAGVTTTLGHFVYLAPGMLWDSCGESNCRLHGTLISRRILRRVG
jgi:hypothetical protein